MMRPEEMESDWPRIVDDEEKFRLLLQLGSHALPAAVTKVLDLWAEADDEYDRLGLAQEAGALTALAALTMMQDLASHVQDDAKERAEERARIAEKARRDDDRDQ